MLQRNFTIVDVETTGGNALSNRVIEVGILRIEKGELVQKYRSFVNPGFAIPEFISGITGITDQHVKSAPYFEEIAEDIFSLFEDSVLVAHNSMFDYKFLRTEFKRAGWEFTLPTLCTVRLSRVLYPKYKKHNLTALIDRFNFSCQNRHRAFDDAKVLWDFLKLIHKDFDPVSVTQAIDRTIKKVPPKKQLKAGLNTEPEIIYEEIFF